MTNEQKARLFLAGLVCITALLILFAGIQGVIFYEVHQEKMRSSQTWAQTKTNEIATNLSTKMHALALVADEFAKALSTPDCSPCNIDATLKLFYLKHSDFNSIGVAFNRLESGTHLQLYAPFIRRNSAGAEIERLDSYYDYQAAIAIDLKNLTKNPEHWYATALNNKPQWLPPFYEKALASYIIRYTTPVYNAQQEKIGLVFVDISLDWLAEQIEQQDIKDNNYLSLEHSQGISLYHSLKSTRQIIKNISLNTGIDKCEPTTINCLTNDSAWHHTRAIATTDWELHTIVDKRTLPDAVEENSASGLSEAQKKHHPLQVLADTNRVAWVSLMVLITILLYSCYRLTRSRTTEQQLWIDTVIYTSIFFIGIVCIWIFEYGAVAIKADDSIILSNKAIVEKYQRIHALSSLIEHDKAPTFVPVGLFIQSIEFVSASNVRVTGYIWHRYQEGQHSDYPIGTIFPEAIETKIDLAYKEKNNGESLKGWHFETVLRENFTPGRFPLDRQSVWIRLWHEKLGDNILLVPDINAYDSLNTLSLPGVEKDFVLSGWGLFRSYFEIRENSYNTRFGRSNNANGDAVPELYFNIELVRNFINPFLAHLFPLMVVVLMLYAIVITMSTKHEQKEFLGFNAAAVVASCSALFFVALIAHVQMRNELNANSVVYLEYFYLITYLIILLITANAVLLSLNVQFRFIQFHDNLLPKLIYWPALAGALFICTAWTFS